MGIASKFQSRRQHVEAVQFNGTTECAERIEKWSEGIAEYYTRGLMTVEVPDGTQIADPGDWIVKDSGGFWVCDDETFERKFEPEAA